MDIPPNLRWKGFWVRDRKRFLMPALAAAAFNPLPWLLPIALKQPPPFRGYGGWEAIDDFGSLLLIGSVLPILGWVFASWSIFGVLAWGSILCWLWWPGFLKNLYWVVTIAWPDLANADRVVALLLAAQLLGYPLAFWLVLRVALGWDCPAPTIGMRR